MKPSSRCQSSLTQQGGSQHEGAIMIVPPNFDLAASGKKKSKRDSIETCETAECCSDALSVTHATTTPADPQRPATAAAAAAAAAAALESDAAAGAEAPAVPAPSRPSRAVSFDTVHFREYSRALGDNPGTTHGPPITLDWDYVDAVTVPVEDYEKERPPRRVGKQMALPGKVRETMLLEETKTTKREMRRMENQVRASRSRRQSSIALVEIEDLQEAAEFVFRRWRRLRRGVTKEREQEMLWEQAQQIASQKNAAVVERKDSQALDCSSSTKDSDSSGDSTGDSVDDEAVVCSAE